MHACGRNAVVLRHIWCITLRNTPWGIWVCPLPTVLHSYCNARTCSYQLMEYWHPHLSLCCQLLLELMSLAVGAAQDGDVTCF